MNRCFRYLMLCMACVLAALHAVATHIVGGEVTYVCNGGNNYTVYVSIYQDCLNGDPQAIAQDNPGIVAIFTGNGARYRIDTVSEASKISVPKNFNNSCITNPPNTCLNKVTFIKNYDLPVSASGYYIVYQRCCRNAQILNIRNPGTVGATYYAIIPPPTIGSNCNNSAVFKNYPPQIICINNPLVYDHSATDADGDSLSYEFCDAYEGGAANDAKPEPTSLNFGTVPYAPGYSAMNPMGTGVPPPLQINPVTGIISGTPNRLGRFVVTVCCHEWRNHVQINTVKREFQFVVANCSKAVVANIPQYSTEYNTYIVQCKSKTVHFVNLSTGGFKYSWDFGVPGVSNDTSGEFEPDFTYPDTGTYVVKLVVNRGSTCPDSISRFVKVYPDFKADYSFSGLPCPRQPIQFTDLSTATYKPIDSWHWDFGDSTTSSVENPSHTYAEGGVYPVILAAHTVKGCVDTARKSVLIERFMPFAGNDTIIVKGEHINFHATGGSFYTWTPSTYLNDPDISNPVGYYPDTTRLNYFVHIKSEVGCEGDDTVNVWVVGQAALFVPSAFTPNGDGLNDRLRPIGIGYHSFNYFRVFNRWGQVVYSSIYLEDAGWDGTFGGKPAPLDTYFYELSINDRFGKVQKLKGDVTLIR